MTIQVQGQLQYIHVHIPNHRSKYMLSQWEHMRIIVSIGKNIDISMDAKGQTIELTMQPDMRSKYMLSQWEHMRIIVTIGKNIDISMDAKGQTIELTMQPDTTDDSDLQRCASFIQAVILGFSIPVARVLLNRDNVYVDIINFTEANAEQQLPKQLDTKLLYLNINKAKSDIEQSTGTNILMDNTKIYILGSTMCIKNSKDQLGHLISLYTTS